MRSVQEVYPSARLRNPLTSCFSLRRSERNGHVSGMNRSSHVDGSRGRVRTETEPRKSRASAPSLAPWGHGHLLFLQQAVGQVVHPEAVGLGAVPGPGAPGRLAHPPAIRGRGGGGSRRGCRYCSPGPGGGDPNAPSGGLRLFQCGFPGQGRHATGPQNEQQQCARERSALGPPQQVEREYRRLSRVRARDRGRAGRQGAQQPITPAPVCICLAHPLGPLEEVGVRLEVTERHRAIRGHQPASANSQHTGGPRQTTRLAGPGANLPPPAGCYCGAEGGLGLCWPALP